MTQAQARKLSPDSGLVGVGVRLRFSRDKLIPSPPSLSLSHPLPNLFLFSISVIRLSLSASILFVTCSPFPFLLLAGKKVISFECMSLPKSQVEV